MAGTTPGPPGASGTPGTPRVLRAMNDRAALDLLLEHGPLSRTRIGKLTGLSKPTASQLLARLEAAGLVVATGTSEGRPGPSAQLYTVNPRAAHVAGLDVNGQRIVAAVADVTGATVGQFELATPGRRADSVVRQVADALDGAVKEAGLTRADVHRIVIGTPGAFDPGTGRLRYASHLPGWHSPTLLDELAAFLPMPVEYENDVNLVAVAEQRLGAARGHEDFVLLWNEEGLGAALVINGRLHRGFTGGAGEVGFLPVPGTPLVRQVVKANSGGFQELAGAQAVPRLAKALGIDTPQQPYAKVAAELLARAADAYEEDEALTELLRQYAQRLATGLASVTAVLDPGLIVLSGRAVAAGGEILRSLIQSELAELAASRPRLVVGEIDRTPVLRGALERALADTRDEVFDTSR
ncbi:MULTISPECIES: ROK family transcriptional regulator [Streptomyces]|uniref:ROK family transcriptional regulator n=1 Tax=Streptomyces sp. JL1001 TaxID=3078227 RepID=A0AAU8KDC6_9ACTN|nr:MULTISPECIES: ROK family transcriptional regulator [Streptomyces]KAA6203456.1 ROK family transcriptional regulator [Streptomyces parvus]PJN27598.1 ROK family transcriptional regulator [Streptomyces sp. CB02613]PVC87199.1 ROK family transcriptional regulator [Streptomyces sp. CS131]SCE60615.1 Sugar kinase of the NBD/HSP70 family, may contain an N-terminal HTH domain [Streptomyces sp. Termitarium-T10T-6]SCF62340.1 Sugar kinase of the NBD/HSP70 family, may contain an N-terminal HTH domain [Str